MFKLIVFDLDFTLWDAGGTWCDHTYPPYSFTNGKVYDAYGAHIKLYPDVKEILERLKNDNYKIGVASRTGAPAIAQKLIEMFDLDRYFDYKQIYPASKLNHFSELHASSGIEYEEMVFFDDEDRNIEEVSTLGVKTIFVRNGVIMNMVLDALK